MNSRLVSIARIVYVVGAWLFAGGVLVTVFMAGLSLFMSGNFWATHKDFGYSVGYVVPVLIVAAILGRLPRSHVPLAALVLVLYIIQPIFPSLRGSVPILAALHPVNAMLIFGLSVLHARRARELLQPMARAARVAA